MALTMTRRERTILILTLIVGAVALVYYFGLEQAVNALAAQREQLRQEQKTNQSYLDDLRKKETVDSRYREIERLYSITDQGSKEFTASVEQTFAAIGMTGAKYFPPEEALMKGNEDLGYVKLHIACDGDIRKVAQVLSFFDQQAILVEDLKLTAFLDQERVNIEVWISQIVKLTPEKRRELEAKSRRLRGASGAAREREPMGL